MMKAHQVVLMPMVLIPVKSQQRSAHFVIGLLPLATVFSMFHHASCNRFTNLLLCTMWANSWNHNQSSSCTLVQGKFSMVLLFACIFLCVSNIINILHHCSFYMSQQQNRCSTFVAMSILLPSGDFGYEYMIILGILHTS